MTRQGVIPRAQLLSGTALTALLLLAATASAAESRKQQQFNIPAQDLASALKRYALQADKQIIYSEAVGSGWAPSAVHIILSDPALCDICLTIQSNNKVAVRRLGFHRPKGRGRSEEGAG